MYSVTEKRKYKRIELAKKNDKKIVPPYITRFRVKQYEGQEISSPDWDIVSMKNLSAGGMVYAFNKDYNKNLELDSLLDLKIDFFKSIPSINCIGRVVRIEEPMPMTNSMFRITAKFTEIDEQAREMINTNVEAILRKEAKIKDFYYEKLEKMKNFYSATLEKIKDFYSEKLEKMKNFYLEKLDKVKNFYSATLEKIKDFYSEKLEKMKNFYLEKLDKVKNFYSATLEKIKDFYSEKLEKMKNFYLEKLDKVKNFYSATLEKIKDFYSEKLEKMKNAMARKVTMAESKQENSTTLQTINTTKNTVEKKSLPEKATRNIGIKKRFLMTKNVCRVTFRLPKVAAPDGKSVSIVGDFNNWNTHANPMKKLKDGDYSIQLDLEPGREYQFRCLIDELKWENDRNADKYARSVYGNCDNSVVIAGY